MKKLIFLSVTMTAFIAQADIFSCGQLLSTSTLDATVTDKVVFINTAKAPLNNELEGYKMTGYLFTGKHSYRCNYNQEGNSVEWKVLNYSHAGENSENGVVGIQVYSYPQPSLDAKALAADAKAPQSVDCKAEKSPEVTNKLNSQIAAAILGLDTHCKKTSTEAEKKSCSDKVQGIKSKLSADCKGISSKIDDAIAGPQAKVSADVAQPAAPAAQSLKEKRRSRSTK